MTAAIKRFGATAVPWTVSWSAEETFFLDHCTEFRRSSTRAICQPSLPGEGRPQFAKPHSNRQRIAIARGLCDLCGRALSGSTKVSLSHAAPQPHGAAGWAILQTEPMLHRACAAESLRWCPSLKRDIEQGTLMIRQVHRWRAQCALMSAEYVESVTGIAEIAFGHAKVELLAWTDRDEEWLNRGVGA